jgi:hypothetical protein
MDRRRAGQARIAENLAQRQVFEVNGGQGGIEPPTQGFSAQPGN